MMMEVVQFSGEDSPDDKDFNYNYERVLYYTWALPGYDDPNNNYRLKCLPGGCKRKESLSFCNSHHPQHNNIIVTA